VLLVADSDFGRAAHDPKVAERLREAKFLAVAGWADTPLARLADVVLPTATPAERDGTYVNVDRRVQRLTRAFPAPAQVRTGVEVFADLLSRLDGKWSSVTPANVFDLMGEEIPALAEMRYLSIPAHGAPLATGASRDASGAAPTGS
jgi:predicted molibdopterin-dependent oxidoreductase YjgC